MKLTIEQLESRNPAAILSFSVNLLSESMQPIEDVDVGERFYVEIVGRDYDPMTGGIAAVAFDLSWDPKIIQEIDIPQDGEFDAKGIVTDALPVFRGGVIDHETGRIDDLRGAAFLAAGLGRPIGNWRPERTVLLHYEAKAPGSTPFWINQGRSGTTTIPVLNLAGPNIDFERQTITVQPKKTQPVETVDLNKLLGNDVWKVPSWFVGPIQYWSSNVDAVFSQRSAECF